VKISLGCAFSRGALASPVCDNPKRKMLQEKWSCDMSGPKVVRVLTREERMAPSLKLLSALRNAIARCEERCRNEGGIEGKNMPAFKERLRNLEEKVRDANRFSALEDTIRAELAFVQDTYAKARQAVVEQRGRERLRKYSAQFMQAFLDEQREQQVRFHENSRQEVSLTKAQENILHGLRGDSGNGSAELWDAAALAVPEPVTRLERVMAELEILHPESARGFALRLADLYGQPDGLKRDMLRDSLLIELSTAVKEQKEIERAIMELEDVSSLHDLDADTAKAVKSAIRARDCVQLARTHQQIAAMVKKKEEENFAALRRKIVLDGLAALCYEKGMEMATFEEKDGRIVLRKSENVHYGVEIAGMSSPRMQVRVVSFSEKTSPGADIEAENAWCAQLAVLREKSRESGVEIAVDMARRAGEVPVKKICRERPDNRAAQRDILNKAAR
jgi:hypothetical protein